MTAVTVVVVPSEVWTRVADTGLEVYQASGRTVAVYVGQGGVLLPGAPGTPPLALQPLLGERVQGPRCWSVRPAVKP